MLTNNTFTWIGNVNNCCVLGYHGASSSLNGNGDQHVQTYVYSAFITPRTFGGFDTPGNGLGDIHALSHEVSELYDDPFINNVVNAANNRKINHARAHGMSAPGLKGARMLFIDVVL